LENPLGFSVSPAVGLWQCWGWGEGDVPGNTAVFRARFAAGKFAERCPGTAMPRYGPPGRAGLESCSSGTASEAEPGCPETLPSSPPWKNTWAILIALKMIVLLLWGFAKKRCQAFIILEPVRVSVWLTRSGLTFSVKNGFFGII